MAQTVQKFLDAMAHPRRAEIDALRAAIQGAADASGSVWPESVKWNAPSFATAGGEHFVTFRIRPGSIVQLILHTGAAKRTDPLRITVEDPRALLTWLDADRATIAFANADETDGALSEVGRIAGAWAAQLGPSAAG
ncbi:DUF1801 domain-containing protein [Naasia lichenicola]|uniref:DUF1801 domain-containing protein n=1 Tax=Naasia lichenicola TaxID=2565933 RepID=A0A4S4FSX5_9MICO|nr:DUF1801 domain-containing protein [Naasia lichenicola]THG33418.1 DUF1801 domain-containing protein [Naasia lichenicola]